MSINATIIGNVTKDSETRAAGSSQVVKFSVASNRKTKDGESTTFVNCSWFGKRAEAVAQYIRKGDKIAVHGEVYQREYNGKQYLECEVTNVDLCGSKRDSSGGGGHNPAPGGERFVDEVAGRADDNDGFPFACREESWVRA